MAAVPARWFDSVDSLTFRTTGTNVAIQGARTGAATGGDFNTIASYASNETGITRLRPENADSTRDAYPATGGAAGGEGWRDDGPVGTLSAAYDYNADSGNGDSFQKRYQTTTTGDWTWVVSCSGAALVVAKMRIIVYAISSTGADRELFRTTEQSLNAGATEANSTITCTPITGVGVAASWNGILNPDEIIQHEIYVNVTTGNVLGVSLGFRVGVNGLLLSPPSIQQGVTMAANVFAIPFDHGNQGTTASADVTADSAYHQVSATKSQVTGFDARYDTATGATCYMDTAALTGGTITNGNFETAGSVIDGFRSIGTDGDGTLNAWTANVGTWSIASNVVSVSVAGLAAPQIFVGHPDWKDCTITARVQIPTGTSNFNSAMGVVGHWVDANNFVLGIIKFGGAISLLKVVAGVTTEVTFQSSLTITAGNWYWITLDFSGTTCTLTANNDSSGVKGSQVATKSGTISDAAIASGKAGLRPSSGAAGDTWTAQFGGAFVGIFRVTLTGPASWTPVVNAGEPAFNWGTVNPQAGTHAASIFNGASGASGSWYQDLVAGAGSETGTVYLRTSSGSANLILSIAVPAETVTKAVKKVVSDTLTAATDAVTRLFGAHRPISDALTAASDVVTKAVKKVVSDTLTAAVDSVVRTVQYFRPVSDTGTAASDIVTRQVNYKRPISDTLTAAADVVTKAVGKVVSDTLTAAVDAVVRRLAANRSISDTLTPPTELVVRQVGYKRSISDTLTAATDVVTKAVGKVVSDTLAAATDAVVRRLAAVRNIADTLTAAVDTVVRHYQAGRTVFDNLSSGGTTIIKKIFDLWE